MAAKRGKSEGRGTAGAALRAALDAELTPGTEWDGREAKIIAVAADLADRLAEVTARLDADGPTITDAKGNLRAHPLLGEQRQLSSALGKTLEGIRFPWEAVAAESSSPLSVKRSRAAQSRWARRGA